MPDHSGRPNGDGAHVRNARGRRRSRYRDTVANRPGKDDPFSIPHDLLGPLHGRTPIVPDDLRAENNVELYDLLYGLGTSVGWRPGSAKWHEYKDPIRRRKAERKIEREFQRAGILFIVNDILGFWWRSLRWLNKGVLF